MSWGGQPNYGGYGQQRPAYNQAPAQGYGAPPQSQPYGAPPQSQPYGAPPQTHPYGAPQRQPYTAPPGQNPAYGAPQGHNPTYGAPPSHNQPYGAAPGHNQAYRAPAGHNQAYGAPPGQNPTHGAPPPRQQISYGNAPPGSGGYGAQQAHYGSAPPPGGGGYGGHTAAPPPPGVGPEIWGWFQAVDADRSGKITATELQHALTNGNWSPFNAETCRLMIGMFDKDRSGTIDIHEFAALWKYIQDWKSCFDRFDTDRSGNIDANELGNAFRQFGYSLSPQFSHTVIRVFDKKKGNQSIHFDDFIQACVMLKSLTDKFRVKDTSQNGMIQINYEDFLEMVLDTTLIK